MSEETKRVYRNVEQWRELSSKQADSGLSVEQFCEAEGINPGVFYTWRRRLEGPGRVARKKPSKAAEPFIELGAVPSRRAQERCEVRMDLGGGILVSVVRG
jgi:transposase-like protein